MLVYPAQIVGKASEPERVQPSLGRLPDGEKQKREGDCIYFLYPSAAQAKIGTPKYVFVMASTPFPVVPFHCLCPWKSSPVPE